MIPEYTAFTSSKWRTPMVSPMKGDWKRLGGNFTGVPINDETGGVIEDETDSTSFEYILQDGVYTGQP